MRTRAALAATLLLAACGNRYDEILKLEADPVRGEVTYIANCQSCHGADGTGVSGPSLLERLPTLTSTEILMAIDDGPGIMPAYRQQFDEQTMSNLLEFLTLEFQ